MARIKGGAVLISTVHIRSVGLGPSGVGAAALTAGDHPPRRRGTGSSPDFLKFGVLGAKRTGARVQKGLRNMRKPPEAIARLGRALGGACKNDGGSARWRFAGRGVPATGVAYGVQAMV